MAYDRIISPLDYYKILQVSPSASTGEIRKAFRKLAMQYHPDKNPGSIAAEKKFAEIQEAYQVLSDAKKRAAYHFNWYAFYGNTPVTVQEAGTIEELKESFHGFVKIFRYMDPFRLDKDALNKQLLALLSDHNCRLLEGQNNHALLKQVFTIAEFLPLGSIELVCGRLMQFSSSDEEAMRSIRYFLSQSRRYAFWSRYKSLFALLLAVLFCSLVYFYGK